MSDIDFTLSQVIEKISKIYDDMVEEGELLYDFDKEKIMENVFELVQEIPPQYFDVSEEEFTKRARGVILVELLSGLLDKLSPQQIKEFDDAINRSHK